MREAMNLLGRWVAAYERFVEATVQRYDHLTWIEDRQVAAQEKIAEGKYVITQNVRQEAAPLASNDKEMP